MNMEPQVIDIAKQFTKHPGGRFLSDGPFSGEEFREQWLLPALKAGKLCTIIFDGARGYGSSFLDEAFGGLIRVHGISMDAITAAFRLVSKDDPSIVEEIMEYLQSTTLTKSK